MLKTQNFLSPNFPFSLSSPHKFSLSPPTPSIFLHKPISLHSVLAHPELKTQQWQTHVSELTDPTNGNAFDDDDEGPIELPRTIFATTDNPSALQVTTSVLLTGSISIFLFRSLRRRAQKAKELKFRSDGVTKSIKEEAMDSLKAISTGPIESKSTPSPIQAFLGAIAAGVIAIILYKFTTTIEASLNRQTISDNLSVRQLTITIRTIVTGICYLATFVFGINSVGLFLYSGQLVINSFMEGSPDKKSETKGDEKVSSPNSTVETTLDGIELSSNKDDQSSNNVQ